MPRRLISEQPPRHSTVAIWRAEGPDKPLPLVGRGWGGVFHFDAPTDQKEFPWRTGSN
ncbi:hypothetical protein FHT80_004024 [Rhizobium sp. BK226]|jgi:hypothetical protein|nr:hypothetical protein [Rhizobium sp. BK112]MBB3370394.1 hypothetical protein [Rhizobium sp. BK077]MBB3745287.1 hypothetical protein [Rhizobium sp. BK591]MBB4114666.1 hypothetical protein [Rhizobium sp. BK226]MBB4181437.1 hypothetical protein [Rhizobium sp. BK109]MBB4253443.1 hypothetical protein [Rhizobium sp. BK008]